MIPYNVCIIKPNKNSYSETFIQEHINRLAGNIKVLYGGDFPLFDDEGNYLIHSKIELLIYLIQKKIFKKKDIRIRNNALAFYLQKEKIDVVLAEYGMVGAMVTTACKMANVPLVIHFHGADAHHSPTVKKYLSYYKLSFNYANAIIAVSSDMAKALAKLGAPNEKIILNPYGVDTTLFNKTSTECVKPYFLSVGRFVPKKSPDSVVKAFQIVSEKIPEARLWMVGNGPLYQNTCNLVKKLNLSAKVTFLGIKSSSDIALLMKQTFCFVQHSVTDSNGDMEGTPNAILEAEASGLPVVSTLHAGIKEAVIDGQTGYLVNEFDVNGMAAKMVEIVTSPSIAKTFGIAARNHIVKNYDIKKRIIILNSVLKKAIALN